MKDKPNTARRSAIVPKYVGLLDVSIRSIVSPDPLGTWVDCGRTGDCRFTGDVAGTDSLSIGDVLVAADHRD